MARDSSGTESLPAGNPVVSGQTISSAWANSTLNDVASELTNSLDRNGRGGMLQPLKLPDGTVSSPSLAFTSEPSTGLYKVSANDVGVAVNGVKRAEINSTGTTLYGTLMTTGANTLGGNTSITGTLSVTGAVTLSANAVVTSNITDGAVTSAKRAALNQVTSSSSGAYSRGATSPATVLTAGAITTTGRPVMVLLQPDGTTNTSNIGCIASGGSGAFSANFYVYRDSTLIGQVSVGTNGASPSQSYVPPGVISVVDTGAGAGAHTYILQAAASSTDCTAWVRYAVLTVYEL